MKNRIILDCLAAKNTVSGLYQVCLNLGNALLRHADPSREEFSFYVHQSQPDLFGGDQRYIIHKESYRFFQHKLQACDVWHSSIQDARIKPLNRRIKMVLTIHDLNFLIQRKGEPSKIKKYLGRVQASVNRADHIVCISEYTRQTVLEHLRTHGKPVDLIYNGCTINEFPDFDAPVYRPSRPYIFALGALVPKKNFHVLPCLLKNNDYELVISGTRHNEYERLIMQQADQFGVTNRVRLTGEISEKDKFWYYKHCTAFAFPSLAEGFGLPLVEAMYYGKPAFIAATTSLPEIGGDLAYRFNHFEPEYMQDVFEKGMQNYERAKPMQAIRERALKYSWDQAAMDYLSVYRKLIGDTNQ
ncbi:glycosyltransferase family 4 protein [Niastella caeni]|uniref:glycosyltransferase family 4 protein n=1 Tax=Niastella caeni TaxID=2569763 RepID=UPI00140BBA9E|nr:glycosyltransferase family 1 protein [Niastella caeni]